MPNDVLTAMSESWRYFHELVEEPLGKVLGIDRFELIEGIDNNIAQELDRTAGIDAIGYHHSGLIGLALRIQYDTFYETFTIRCHREPGAKTEYELDFCQNFAWCQTGKPLKLQCFRKPIADTTCNYDIKKTKTQYSYIYTSLIFKGLPIFSLEKLAKVETKSVLTPFAGAPWHHA